MTQLSSETWKCYDAVQRELHSNALRGDLPAHWVLGVTPLWSEIEEVLLHYYPSVAEKTNVVHQAKLLLDYCYCIRGVEKKELLGRALFRLLAVNKWLIDEHPNLARTIRNKFIEFKNDSHQVNNNVSKDFVWILEGTGFSVPQHSYYLRSTMRKCDQ